MDISDISGQVVSSAIKVHTALGPGLLESAYKACMAHDLRRRGLSIEVEVPMPIEFDGARIDVGYRLDLIVERQVVVELKAVSKVLPIHQAQLLSYLRLGGFPVGLLLNFHVPRMRDGILRLAN